MNEQARIERRQAMAAKSSDYLHWASHLAASPGKRGEGFPPPAMGAPEKGS